LTEIICGSIGIIFLMDAFIFSSLGFFGLQAEIMDTVVSAASNMTNFFIYILQLSCQVISAKNHIALSGTTRMERRQH
jgi:hypothetical protein